jgi:hypothetical protein
VETRCGKLLLFLQDYAPACSSQKFNEISFKITDHPVYSPDLIIKARTDYANRACNVTCNVMLVAKLVPRTADEPSAQRTASILRSLIDRTPFHRHRDECLCCKKSNSAHNICLSLIHTRRINNSTSFRFTAVILLTTS